MITGLALLPLCIHATLVQASKVEKDYLWPTPNSNASKIPSQRVLAREISKSMP